MPPWPGGVTRTRTTLRPCAERPLARTARSSTSSVTAGLASVAGHGAQPRRRVRAQVGGERAAGLCGRGGDGDEPGPLVGLDRDRRARSQRRAPPQRERPSRHGGLARRVEQHVAHGDRTAHERVDRAVVGHLPRRGERAGERGLSAERAGVEPVIERRDVVAARAGVLPADRVAAQHVDERGVEGRVADRDLRAGGAGAVVLLRGGGRRERQRQRGERHERGAPHRRRTR